MWEHRSLVRSCVAAAVLCAARLDAQGAKTTPAARYLDSARTLIAKATPLGDLAMLRSARVLLDRAAIAAPNDPWVLHYLGYELYREATLSMGREGADVKEILERCDSILQMSAALAAIPENHALRSGVLGMMIGSSPLKGITLGPRSGAQIERALTLGPDNPRVWLLRGIGAFNTPAMFGGGMDNAKEYLTKSIALFAKDNPTGKAPSWGRHEAWVWMGQAYVKEGKLDSARAAYNRALEIEPNDGWVRMALLPALDKKK